MEYIPQTGDVFLVNSNKTGAKIVKFLMQSPTVWHQIWRYFRKTLQPVRYYHAGMVLYTSKIIEQNWKVELNDFGDLLSKDIIIYRKKDLGDSNITTLKERANEDLGKIYDIPQIIGKTFTWLTGITLFVDLLGALSKEEEICVTRVSHWYKNICNFGVKDNSEITTKIIDEYCQNHPNEWEIVYEN